jgi:spore coat polysaccharide biosynthesis protein SpsF
MSSRVVAVIQARMSSQRLPGKVLRPLAGADDAERRVLDWVVGRLRRCRALDEVVVATSVENSDDRLAEHCATTGVACYRGALDDVLDRFYRAAREHGADTVVRITADCPLVDPDIVGEVLQAHFARGGDFTANRLPPPAQRTFPIGLDVEVADMAALATAWRSADERYEREHVMPYLYRVPDRFDVEVVQAPVEAGDVRWTVDTPADLEAVRELVRAANATLATDWRTLLDVWRAHPELARINADVRQRSGTDVDPRS